MHDVVATHPPDPSRTPGRALMRGSVEGINEVNPWAVAALICALLGVVTYVAAPAGAIMGHIAVRRIRRAGRGSMPMARAGILIGWAITLVYSCGLLISAAWIVSRGLVIYRMFF